MLIAPFVTELFIRLFGVGARDSATSRAPLPLFFAGVTKVLPGELFLAVVIVAACDKPILGLRWRSGYREV